MSHNLKTPLNAMKLYTESMKEKIHQHIPIEPNIVANININIILLESMINDILDYSNFNKSYFLLNIK